MAALVHVISLLTSSLEDLTCNFHTRREALLEDAISSFVCRRGSSLRSFNSDVLLSEAAIHHLMQLPNLRCWAASYHEPPPTPPPVAFPPLKVLSLKQAALPWLHLFASHGKEIVQEGSIPAASRSNIKETLESLMYLSATTIDPTFVSSVINFRNLAFLQVNGYCLGPEGCISRLTDGDVERLAAALPRLETLRLESPCSSNSCNTTVASLMSISVNCLNLMVLEVHFNTVDIVRDLRLLIDGSSGHDRPKCKVGGLMVGDVPLDVHEVDVETVAMGFRAILPCLANFIGSGKWLSVQAALSALD